MSSTQDGSQTGARASELETGPYLLRPLLSDIDLTDNGALSDTRITCVEYWNENVYIGTSKGEVLHFVSIPPEPGESSLSKTLIQAFRFHPVSNGGNDTSNLIHGIQQILILPTALKACILSNGTLTFYTLPELTPAFGSIKVSNCTWVGGVNQNATQEQMEEDGGVEVLVCLKNRMRIVKLGDTTHRMGDIEIGGCVTAARRDNVASVADSKSYSLVDVVEKQMIPLFSISTLEQSPDDTEDEQQQVSSGLAQPPADSTPEAEAGAVSEPDPEPQNLADDDHTAIVMENNDEHESESTSSQKFPPRFSSKGLAEASEASTSVESATSESSQSATKKVDTKNQPKKSALVPHILSPNPEEFLLTTGTSFEEPGVGMFVNMEGDVVPRPPLEFARYPYEIVIDGQSNDTQGFETENSSNETSYILALFKGGDEMRHGSIEIQKLALDPSETRESKQIIELEQYCKTPENRATISGLYSGIRTTTSAIEIALGEVVETLALKPVPLQIFSNLVTSPKTSQNKSSSVRQREEQKFIERLSNTQSQITVWANDCLWNVVRNPLILRLDAQLQQSMSHDSSVGYAGLNRQKIEFVINDIRGLEPNNELEFFALKFVRQKASLLLFLNLVYRTLAAQNIFERDTQITEEVLMAGEIDPRVVLAAVPSLGEEIVVGSDGLWLQGGLLNILNEFVNRHDLPNSLDINSTFSAAILPMVKRFLFSWRRKKGFGSITDEDAVFKSVDAAVMRLLLLLDSSSPKGPATKGSVRSELYGVVDRGVDAFERAISLLEQHKRLYVLSRLYQSRKMSAQVLATWKRILEGEEDFGGEFGDGFNEVRRYLSYLKDSALVQEYGCWLAKMNPKLGVQVFADENSRVKFPPKQVIEILKREAPAAVKEYLEYLVFGKKKQLPQYANDLVGYYFDSVITELENSNSAKATIMQTYEEYRALDLPKPTYTQFIDGKAIKDDWWRNRIRLLQLLGGSHGATSQYDVKNVLQRIAPYEQELVPELIIVYGRQGRHTEAIRLLTHGLGDLDTAITYCVMGGSSTYTPVSGSLPRESVSTRQEQENLFKALLGEFLKIENPKTCMMQTSELLERFASWFDIEHVLSIVPDEWPVDSLLGFLENRFRHLISERNQSAIERALVSVQNLGISSKLVEKIEALGPIMQELQPGITT